MTAFRQAVLAALPDDHAAATLAGRVWRPGLEGPSVVAVRDGAVFGVDGSDRPFIVDFQWTHYGWTNWCRRVFAGSRAPARGWTR